MAPGTPFNADPRWTLRQGSDGSQRSKFSVKKTHCWDFPGGPVAKPQHSLCMDPGSIPGQGTISHMPQLRVLHATTKDPEYHN